MDKAFNKILLAFDNSDASQVALQKACNFAAKFNSAITALAVSTDVTQTFAESKKYLEDFATSKGIALDIVERKGKVYDEVSKFEKEGDFSLIVLGSHGKSGWTPFWAGSNAFKVMSASNCPVISVQADSEGLNMDHILLPLADSNSTRQKVPYCAEIAKRFNSTVHILGISKGSGSETENKVNSYMRQTERFLAERGLKYTIASDFGVKVPERIMEYSKEINAGLLLIMTETESSGLFMDSYSQQLVNQSTVPVMSVHSRDTRLAGQAGY
jgi:nucleotide-binding universal stress UspA family protein